MSDKTEEPTPRRLSRAIEQGDVPVSSALVSGCVFLAVALLLPSLGASLVERSALLLTRAPTLPPEALASEALRALVIGAVPALAVAAAVALLIGGVQARGAFAPGKLAPDANRLAGGLGALLSGQRIVGLARALLTAALVAHLCRSRVIEALPALAAGAGEPRRVAALVGTTAATLFRDVGLLLVASALIDLLLTLRSWRNKLKMSPDEVKREARESEGDPQLKAARERAHHELLAQASIHAVKEASVVVVNPTHLATALRYQQGEDEAPTIVAQGEGNLAARIVEAARAYNVPVVQDIPLAHALRELEVGGQIPEALYEAVAEILRSLWENPPENSRWTAMDSSSVKRSSFGSTTESSPLARSRAKCCDGRLRLAIIT